MKKLVYILIALSFTSCLKEIEAADNVDTNIFDRDYKGEKWFEAEDLTYLENEDGDYVVRISAVLPSENMPIYHPSHVRMYAHVNNQEIGVITAYQNSNGDYPISIDAEIDGSQEYCIILGIYDEDEEESFNEFVDCVSF